MVTMITASMLYEFVQCPHRVFLDLFGDPNDKDPTNRFVELLWERGTAYEKQVVQGLKQPFTDLSGAPVGERERLTEEAITRGEPLIYGGRIAIDDLLGEPDLLRRHGEEYIPGDIKSGAAEEGASEDEEGRPKRHYAVQLALYTDILARKHGLATREPFIWDIHGREVTYALDEPLGPRTRNTLWQIYEDARTETQSIIDGARVTRPALSSVCKLCHWHTSCFRQLREEDDVTLIPELGRSKRESLSPRIATVRDLASADLGTLIVGRQTVFHRIGPETLRRFHQRACLQKRPCPVPFFLQPHEFAASPTELFFDIETDPMRDICYLHGFVVRHKGKTDSEEYIGFFAESPTKEAEEAAFSQAVAFLRSHMPCVVYFYSKYERTWWRALQQRYPWVVATDQIDRWFAGPVGVDLYGDVVKPITIWPTHDHSIKTLASFLGFQWRDTEPSGAASIEWFDRWVESGDPAVKERILAYNEDDCRAMRVLLDGLRSLRVEDA